MHVQKTTSWSIAVLLSAAALGSAAEPSRPADTVMVGVAKIDITPSHPVRLTGYASRKTESEGVAQTLWAKALAIGGDEGEGPAVLVAVDNCGVPGEMTEQLAARLKADAGVKPERLAVCSTHTHTGPWLKGFLPWHFAENLPEEHRQHIVQYTQRLAERLDQVALEALASRRPGRLAWGQGTVGFAANRRVLKNGKWAGFGVQKDGPVDHSLPILRVTDPQGNLTAVVLNYACHCTTLGGQHNRVHGDWAGCAQELIEADCPGAMAMVCIGCGADANPQPRGKMEMTRQHGREVADEVKRLLAGELTPITPKLTAGRVCLELPFGKLPTREELQQRVAAGKAPDASSGAKRFGLHANDLLELLDRDGHLPATLMYPVTTWVFGGQLAMVFLPGEVVVDYALRMKRQLNGPRLWITAYANDEPCYIASRRVIEEGGYEVDSSMICYGRPARLDPSVEDQIVDAVRTLLPEDFRSPSK